MNVEKFKKDIKTKNTYYEISYWIHVSCIFATAFTIKKDIAVALFFLSIGLIWFSISAVLAFKGDSLDIRRKRDDELERVVTLDMFILFLGYMFY